MLYLSIIRMKTTENCEQIIQAFNKKMIPGCREPLLVKFADSANKKRDKYKNKETRGWDRSEVIIYKNFLIILPEKKIEITLGFSLWLS